MSDTKTNTAYGAPGAMIQQAVGVFHTCMQRRTTLNRLTGKMPTEAEAAPTCGGSAFLNRIIDEILSTSLTFLNPRKAAQTLLGALDHILQELGLAYSDEIAVKFVFHCSHMLERILRSDSLKYPQLKQFLAEHRRLFAVLEQQMALVGEVFGVFIPDCERAYIAEIFLPFEPDQPTR